jgi:uncharacterized protein
MNPSNALLLARIEQHARHACAGHDQAHDALHLARVVANARRLAAAERAGGAAVDTFIVEAAAWLHDLVQLPKGEGAPGEAAHRSAQAARELLAALDIAPECINAIAHAVEVHSFSGGRRPETLEAAIVQDADRLDALGAIGLARLWIVAAGTPGALYDESDPLAANRPLDDRLFDLDHIGKKLLLLPELMNTATGRRLAEERAAFVEQFRAQFVAEIGVAACTER